MKGLPSLRESISLRDTLSLLYNWFNEYRKHIHSSLALAGFLLGSICLYYGFEYYVKNHRIPLTFLRKIIIQTINQELGKAVDIGVLDFSLREGLILEDLVISQDEDFSFNEHLVKVKKVTFRMSGFWKSSPNIERIDFYSPHIVTDTDSKIRSQLIQYLQTTKVKHISFHDFRLTLRSGDSSIVDWKEGWEVNLERKNQKISVNYSNGWFWLPNTTRIKGEGYFSELDFDEFSFNFKWKNFPSEEAILLTEYILGAPVHSAVLTGEAKIEKFPNQSYIMSGGAEFENSLIPIPFISGYVFDGFRFNEKFSFSDKKEERVFSSYDFLIKYTKEKLETKEPTELRNLEFSISALDEITNYIFTISGESGIPLQGSLKGSLSLKETGERNKWFQLDGDVLGENLVWESDLFTLNEGQVQIKINPANRMQLGSNFSLFGKKGKLSLVSDLDWSRQKKTDGSFYYPMNSKSKASFVIDSLVASDWFPLFTDWKENTMDEIKERQEKLIPEEYFYQKKIYKYFLESMNFELAVLFESYYPFPDAKSLGETRGNLIVKDGRFNLNLPLGNSGNKISIVSYFASKTPNFGFSIFLTEYPWDRSWINLCGTELSPKWIDLDYSFNSIGSDYYMLHKDARMNYFLRLGLVQMKKPEVFTKLEFPIQKFEDPFSVEFNSDHYFDTDFLRNLAISGEGIDLKGYGSNKTGEFVYSLYGAIGDTRGNWTISEEEDRCVIK
ncbi:MAG: hypothetical protein O9301_13780 [Leptospira sp.]|nr:hypothetical protein [Leptospira sp.]